MKFLTNPLSGLALLLTIMTLSACGTHKDLVYMQNDTYGQLEEILNLNKIKVQPQDQLSIIVSCKEEELASLVNLKRPTASGGGGESGRLVYTVDESGDINFPQLGKIHIAGLTREEISEKIGACKPHLSHGVMIAVGAAFKFFSGVDTSRAPQWMVRNHLEFVHRLGKEPRKQFSRCFDIVRTLPGLLYGEWRRKRQKQSLNTI